MNQRQLAARVLLRVIKDGQSLTVALDSELAQVPDAKDRAFIQAMCYGVCRYYHRLEFIGQQLLPKPLRNKDKDIQMLLLLGLYQLRYMRVKSHAAVSETVAASRKKPWAKSLINGVLRQYQREQESLEQKADEDDLGRLSHPQWMLECLQECWPDQVERLLLANNEPPPMVLRINVSRISRDDYLQRLAEQQIAARRVDACPTAIMLEQAVNVESLPGFNDGLVSVQDTAAQLASMLLEAQAGDSVLDLCAAPGGKTAAILEQQPQVQSLLAVDVDAVRLQRVEENLRRLQLQAETLAADASKPEDWAKGRQFDRILLDAPCSALGVIRRHPDIKLLRRDTDIPELQQLQSRILDAAWRLLKPGGVLLYATCSVLKQENEDQIAAFVERHQDAEEIKIAVEWGQERPFGRQILTGSGQMDGFYYAKLHKRA